MRWWEKRGERRGGFESMGDRGRRKGEVGRIGGKEKWGEGGGAEVDGRGGRERVRRVETRVQREKGCREGGREGGRGRVREEWELPSDAMTDAASCVRPLRHRLGHR
jgi:hypothetical protein